MPNDLQHTTALLEEDRGDLHLGGQLYVSIDGTRVVGRVFGEARPGEALRGDAPMLWLSSGKPVTAVAIARLWEDGALGLDDTVARHIPEFGVKGKESVTVRHLLTHTAGIRTLGLGWPQCSWPEILRQICDMKLEPRWVPGHTAGYHLTSSWFVLGEIIQRLTGEAFSDHVQRRIFEPLRMRNCWIGMPVETYEEHGERVVPMFDTSATEPRLHDWTNECQLTRPSPGANGLGPISELARLYEMLLGGGELDGMRLLTPPAVEAITARQRVGLYDKTFRQILDWGLGFVLDSRHYGQDLPAYGYGEHASPRTFGHSGYRSSTAFADPEAGLVVALAVNGTPSAREHARRFHRLTTAIYEDLGLARTRADPRLRVRRRSE